MNAKQKKFIQYTVSILLAVVLLYFSFRGVKWSDFWDALKACKWEFVILSMAFGALAFYLRALRWRELLLPIDPKTGRISTFNAINISYIVNLVLPRVGEFARCGVITANSSMSEPDENGRTHHLASLDKVLGTVALERSWDLVTLIILLVVFMFFGWARYGDFFNDNIMKPAMGKMSWQKVLIIILITLAVIAIIWAIVKVGRRNRKVGKVSQFFNGIWTGIGSCMKMKGAWKFFATTIGIWTCYWMMSYTILLAVQGMDLTKVSADLAGSIDKLSGLNGVDGLFLMLAGSLASIVPVPGGFGAFHYIVALALQTIYGIPFEVGIIFATLSHESQVVNQIICGGISYIAEAVKHRKTV
jgi:uncharacterized membrane protein YbhN (UPF0104 family)